MKIYGLRIDYSITAKAEPDGDFEEVGFGGTSECTSLVECALTPDPSHAGMGTRHVGMDWAREMADAVLAAMPDLMGGAS